MSRFSASTSINFMPVNPDREAILNLASCGGRCRDVGDELGKVLRLGRLDQICIDAELCGAGAVDLLGGGSENHYREVLETGLRANPGEDFEAVQVRQFQIQEHERGQRVVI